MKGWCILLTCCVCFLLPAFATGDSVLDLVDSCGKIMIEKNICISPESKLITKRRQARTDLECAMGCRDLSTCISVYRDTNGNCYEFAQSDIIRIDKNVGEPVGNLLSIYSTGDVSACNGQVCNMGEVCLTGCGDVPITPLCVGDQRSTCDLGQEYANARYYWTPTVNDDKDSGELMVVTYPKKRQSTGIRVIMHMSVSGGPSCTRWYLTFNGMECSDPNTIDHMSYTTSAGNYERSMDIDGTCYGLADGDLQITLVVSPCQGYETTDASSGNGVSRSMIVMEVIPQDTPMTPLPCPHGCVFNYQYYTWNEEVEQTFNTASLAVHSIKTLTYTKRADDTSLRVKYSAAMSIEALNSSNYCGRWFIRIDGVECDPIADVIIFHGGSNAEVYWDNFHRVMTLEGICDNVLAAGPHNIEICTGKCITPYIQTTTFRTGLGNTTSRLHIEEVREDKRIHGVYDHKNSIFRSLTGKLSRYHFYNGFAFGDNGPIFTISYTKEFADTGLRLTASGSHANVYDSANGFEKCARWYFLIDDAECGNPGTIEGTSSFNYHTTSYQPMQVSGLCNGIAAGTRAIKYAVGICAGYASASDALTGIEASFHIFVEELSVDIVQTCTSASPADCGAP